MITWQLIAYTIAVLLCLDSIATKCVNSIGRRLGECTVAIVEELRRGKN